MKTMNDFIRLYPLSKTLRFKLIPLRKTLEYIVSNGLLEQDRHRAESYVRVKDIIDNYHKAFIERVLSTFKLQYADRQSKDSLEEYYIYYMVGNKTEEQLKVFSEIQEKLRKQIAGCLVSDPVFKRIDKKELIKEDLVDFVSTEEERQLIAEFKDYTTYFTGFHENRRNMYSSEAQSTAIAYRLIHENLPKFIDNLQVFSKMAATSVAEKLPQLYADFEEYLNVAEINDMFRLDYFNVLLTQTQIDVYNAIIGGKALEDGTRIQGLNEYINLYNQQQKDKHVRLPKFKLLYKQILSDRNAISWLPDEFVSDNETLEAIERCYEDLESQILNRKVEGEHSLKTLLEGLEEYDLAKIYVRNDLQLTDISQKIFGDWSVVQRAYIDTFKNENPLTKKETMDKYEERIEKYWKGLKMLSIADIDARLILSGKDKTQTFACYFRRLGKDVKNDVEQNVFERIEIAYLNVKDLLNTPYPAHKNLAQDKESVEKIKLFLDAVKDLQYFVKPLLEKGLEVEKDERFYGEFIPLWEELDKITPLYNKVRNYLTRKPYSTQKIKLNFENSTLMDGWDENKERDNCTVILRKDGLYYLAIINRNHRKIFDKKIMPSSGECYEKMVYKLLPGANKMLPKVFFSKSRIGEFNPSVRVREIYEKGTFKKGNDFNLEDCYAMIDFFKESINKHEDWSKFGFHFSKTEDYKDLSDFYKEVEQQGYKVSFVNVSQSYVDQLVDEGKLYLFQIYSKDFSPYTKGMPNMHTLYWKMLFDEQNLADVVYKLNGQAEVFYRKASIKSDRPTHPANVPIANKRKGTEKKESVFAYDLIKDKRYTVDHFQFHVPITLNFKSRGAGNINQLVNEYIKQTGDELKIIGIDRGERHLLYLTLIDTKGRIVSGMQFSLNQVDQTDYHQLLTQREEERLKARQSWRTIENIKELKEGYLSQIVHTIATLMVEHNAIVVLEDLNMGFMRGRQKVEKQVYQKFERMLIDKLNYLVDKKKESSEAGGLLKAYQLTSKFESFQKLSKQSGFLFYVPAWNTSKIDPVTGFVNLFDIRYESVDKSKIFLAKFDDIRYNAGKDWFEFSFDYSHFTSKAQDTRQNWTVCSYGERIETYRNPTKNMNWDNREVLLTDEFKNLFQTYGIDYSAGSLKEQILNQTEKSFFCNEKLDKKTPIGLLQLLKLTLQMRNSITGTEVDYLVSPVVDEKGQFYDSRTCGDDLPQNADANGAYNIARKGLWVVQQIRQSTDLKKLKLTILNKEWLRFVQQKLYLE